MNRSAPRSSRRPSVCPEVESMESRALLSGASVHAEVASTVAAEVAVLQGNIATIKTATTNFIAKANADIKYRQADMAANKGNAAQDKKDIAYDKLLISHAGRDEKFAIEQQSTLIRDLNSVQAAYKKMKTPNVTAYQTSITNADAKATADLNGLLGTYAANKA